MESLPILEFIFDNFCKAAESSKTNINVNEV